MSRQQLYIEGRLVDMPNDDIKIKVASNIFSDISKVATAHSYSIALPRTITNDDIFALAYVVGADTGGKTTHKYLKASLYMDGVPLFVDGQAVVNKVDDKGYNLNLFWGLLDVFNDIKNEGLKLCDLPLSAHWNEEWGDWYTLNRTNGVAYDSGMNQTIFDNCDQDSRVLASTHPWNSPYTTMWVILQKIAQVYGITFTYSPKILAEIQALCHPLTSLNRKCKDEIVTCQLVSAVYDRVGYYQDKGLTWSPYRTTNNRTILDNCIKIYGYEGADSGREGKDNTFETRGKLAFGEFHIYGSANHDFCITFNEDWVNKCKVTIGGNPELYDATSEEWKVNAVDNGDGTWSVDINFYNMSYEGFLPRPRLVGGWWLSGTTPVHDIKCDFEITECADAVVGRPYSYVRNYPSMSIMDYLKEMMAHTGAFIVGSITKPNSIQFISLDEVVNKTPVSTDMIGLSSINMALQDIGQKNTYTHKENDDDNLPYDASGVIYSNDETLEFEKKGFESKFKVPRNNFFKQWEIETITEGDDEGKYKAKWVKAGDYICGFDLTTMGLANTGQDFATLIERNYQAYERIINRPKVIEVVVRKNILELLNLDFTKPIYINQLATTFVIDNIATDNGEQYKLTLVRI